MWARSGPRRLLHWPKFAYTSSSEGVVVVVEKMSQGTKPTERGGKEKSARFGFLLFSTNFFSPDRWDRNEQGESSPCSHPQKAGWTGWMDRIHGHRRGVVLPPPLTSPFSPNNPAHPSKGGLREPWKSPLFTSEVMFSCPPQNHQGRQSRPIQPATCCDCVHHAGRCSINLTYNQLQGSVANFVLFWCTRQKIRYGWCDADRWDEVHI